MVDLFAAFLQPQKSSVGDKRTRTKVKIPSLEEEIASDSDAEE